MKQLKKFITQLEAEAAACESEFETEIILPNIKRIYEYKVYELKEIARELGLSVNGTKYELIKRILDEYPK